MWVMATTKTQRLREDKCGKLLTNSAIEIARNAWRGCVVESLSKAWAVNNVGRHVDELDDYEPLFSESKSIISR